MAVNRFHNFHDHEIMNFGVDDDEIAAEIDHDDFEDGQERNREERVRRDFGFGRRGGFGGGGEEFVGGNGFGGGGGFGVGGFGGPAARGRHAARGREAILAENRRRARRGRSHTVKVVDVRDWTSPVELPLEVDEFDRSPAFTTAILIDPNRSYNRVGIKIQPVCASWGSVEVRFIPRTMREHYAFSRLTSSPSMGKIDNGEALFISLLKEDKPEGRDLSLEFVFKPVEEEERVVPEVEQPGNSSPKTIRNQFDPSRLYLSTNFSDFSIISACPNEAEVTLPVHKVIIGNVSPYFKAMFENPVTENIENKVRISNFQTNVLKEVLYYIYHSKVSENINGIYPDVVKAADYFQLTDLKDVCLKKISKTVDRTNLLDLVCLSSQFTDTKIAGKARNFIDTYLTKDEIRAFYTELINDHPQDAIHFLSNT